MKPTDLNYQKLTGEWTNTEWEYNSEADALREIRGMY